MREFASEQHPLHCSQLSKVLGCPLSQVLAMMSNDDESGPAADTGSAVHLAAHTWHAQAAQDLRVAIGVMRAQQALYPLADLDKAEEFFRHYANDRRNVEAKVIQSETQVSFTISPCKTDPTQTPIYIVGTLDQVREINGQLALLDIKTGRMYEGADMLSHHAMQLAAYQIGATKLLGRPVRRAFILRVQDYVKKVPGPVLWEAPWNLSDCESILDGLRHVVASIRSGRIYAAPGGECRWCPQMSVANCLPRLVEIGGLKNV